MCFPSFPTDEWLYSSHSHSHKYDSGHHSLPTTHSFLCSCTHGWWWCVADGSISCSHGDHNVGIGVGFFWCAIHQQVCKLYSLHKGMILISHFMIPPTIANSAKIDLDFNYGWKSLNCSSLFKGGIGYP